MSTDNNWYALIKVVTQFSICYLILIGIAFEKYIIPSSKTYYFAVPTFLTLIMCYLVTCYIDIVRMKEKVTVYDFEGWKDLLNTSTLDVATFYNHEGEVIWFAEQVANDLGRKIIPLSVKQFYRVQRISYPQMDQQSQCFQEFPPNADIRGWPFDMRLIGVKKNSDQLMLDENLSLSLTDSKDIGRIASFDFVEVNTGNKFNAKFINPSWAVDGVWKGCFGESFNKREISFTIDIPTFMFKNENVKIKIVNGSKIKNYEFFRPGRYVVALSNFDSRSESDLIKIITTSTWMPSEVDSTSSDQRELSFSVVGINSY